MRNMIFLCLAYFFIACGSNTVSEKTEFVLDQSNPENVVNAIFEAAKTGNLDLLTGLCDPMAENDGDTRRMCAANEANDQEKEEFITYFKDGKIAGEVLIEGDEARVPFLFGPGATENEEMVLINRDGKWYLYSF